MRFLQALFLIPVFATMTAQAAAENVDLPTKTQWRITRRLCPVTCSRQIRTFLDGYIGQEVQLSEGHFSAPFLDACDGTVRIALRKRSVQALIQELNQTHGKVAKFTVKALGLAGLNVISGIVYCTMEGKELPLARLPLVSEQRLLILFAQQALVELN